MAWSWGSTCLAKGPLGRYAPERFVARTRLHLGSLSPEIGCADYLAPSLSFFDDEFAEIGGRTPHRRSTQLVKACFYHRIGNSEIEPQQVRLTSQGEEMLRDCRKVLSEVEALTERARAVKKGQSGILRVGATPQVTETLLSDFILTFRRRHPQVEIHLSEQGGARQFAHVPLRAIVVTAAFADARRQHHLVRPLPVSVGRRQLALPAHLRTVV